MQIIGNTHFTVTGVLKTQISGSRTDINRLHQSFMQFKLSTPVDQIIAQLIERTTGLNYTKNKIKNLQLYKLTIKSLNILGLIR